MTQSIESFNHRIKAIDGNQTVNIFNFDRQKQPQNIINESVKLKSQQHQLSKYPNVYYSQPHCMSHFTKVSVSKQDQSQSSNRVNFEPAAWTEVNQTEGTLNKNTYNSETKSLSKQLEAPKVPQNKNTIINVTDQGIIFDINKVKAANHKSLQQSGSTSPFVKDSRTETKVQSPLRMWKKMNEENWLRIKRDGYIPIPLKSTKSANIQRIQLSQMSNIRPILNHEQLTMHAHQIQA